MANALTAPELPGPSCVSLTAYRTLPFGCSARKLGLGVSAARPSGLSVPVSSSKRNA
jgi:hypothetical protein